MHRKLLYFVSFLIFSPLIFASDPLDVRIGDLTIEETKTLAGNLKIGGELIGYDHFSWIATDSIVNYRKNHEIKPYEGWIVVGEESRKTVIFGMLTDTSLTTSYRVIFSNKNCERVLTTDTSYNKDSDAYKGFKAMIAMRTSLMNEFESLKAPMNSYVLYNNDTISVYHFPGSTDEYIILGGGYRNKYLKNTLKEIESVKLHRSLIVCKMPEEKYESYMRTSSHANVINEVDIAQSIIFEDYLPPQYILTPKYYFSIKRIPNTERIMVGATIVEDKKLLKIQKKIQEK